jgi:outer membrane biosynthesis protein TonB
MRTSLILLASVLFTAAPVTRIKPTPQTDEGRKKLLAAMKRESCKADMPSGSATAGESYYALLASRIHPFYTLPSLLKDLSLKAQVKVRLDQAGEVLETVLVSFSGNPSFDDAVLTTIKDASPWLCPPPAHLRDAVQKQGVILEFTP